MSGLNKHTGQTVATLQDHVRQSIGDILTTPLGSRVMRRDYGSVIPDLIDQPLNSATILRVYAATAAAIMRWEPRFKISGIQLLLDHAKATVEVTGFIDDKQTTITTPVGGV